MTDFIISGRSQNGTSSSDTFNIQNGQSLSVDGGDGLDTLKIDISGSIDISYNSSTHIRTLSGIDSSVTGTFQSFENTTIQAGTGNDNISLISTQDSNPLYISGGSGTDSITLPNNGVNSVIYNIYEMVRPDQSPVLQVSAQALGDVTLSDFEILKLGYSGSQPWILNTSGNIACNFSEIVGTQGGQDTINVSTNQDMYLWKDAQGVHLGIQGDNTPVLLRDFEVLKISASHLFIQTGALATNPYEGQTRYSLKDLEFVTGSEIVQLTNLDTSTFVPLVSGSMAPNIVPTTVSSNTAGIFILPGSNQTGTSSSDSFEVQSGSALSVDGGDGLDTLKIDISGSIDISYNSSTHIRTLSGIDSSVTGTFQSFENTTIQAGTGNDNISLISTQDSNPLYISGGSGTDSITLPNNGVNSVIYNIYEMVRPDQSPVLQVSAQALGDVTLSDFEILKLGYSGSQPWILNTSGNIACNFSEIVGTQGGQDTINVSTNQDMYLWKDAQGVHLGIQGDNTPVLLRDFEVLKISASHLFIQTGALTTNPYEGQTRYGLKDLVFVTGSEIVQLTNLDSPNYSLLSHINVIPSGTVSISGTAIQGQTLTTSNTLSDMDGLGTVSYQWLSDNVAITGANQTTYILTQADVGKKISVKASYTDLLETAESVSSTATTTVANVNDAPTGNVTITGTPTQNQILTASNNLADADGLGAISYTWLRDGTAINAATQSTYTLTQADVGKKISVRASYTDLLGTAESVSSTETTAVANVNDAPTGNVTITGTPTQNQILTASNNLADADGLGAISYTWLRDGTAINTATQSTYALTQTDVGKKLSVKASYTDLLGTAESVSITATTAVANINDAPTGTVTITGTATKNQILTASNNLADADGLGAISYTWLRDGTAINTATQSTYTLTQADVGKKITVSASYTDLLGTAESVVSSSVIPVGLVNHLPAGSVTISGTAFKGQVLTASNNLVDTDGLGTISYTWLDNGVVIPNATQSTYKLTQADTGQNISVKANYTDALGTVESAVSSNLAINKNNLPTGTATIKGLSTWGTTLSITSTIKDADGIGKLSYTWQNDKATLSTNATYTLADSDIGKQVWAVVSYTDKKGSLEEVKSNVINVTVSDKPSAVNDVITGTDVANKLNGLAGNDTLIGGLGKDSLTGGVGADVFKFKSVNDSSALPKQADIITDFKHAQGDKIDLSAIDANSVSPSDQAFTLISAATFSADATGQLRFDAKTSTLYGSTNADAVSEFAIVLSGVKTLVAEDFIL
jgi:hypothetical protein